MKKSIIMLAFFSALAVQAQIMNVTTIERIELPQVVDGPTLAVALSPQGDYLLLSSDTKQGLVKWDLSTSTATILTSDAGTGSDVCISEDGRHVVYGQVSYKDRRRHESVKAIDLETGKTKTLLKPSRNLHAIQLEKSTAVVVADGQLKRQALEGKDAQSSRPVLSHHHLKLYITRDGMTTAFAPNGSDERYIWASLSPDATRVLYYVSGHGAFVCDIDGGNLTAMGNLTAPKWWDNNTVVGMDEIDDEYSIVSSRIVACTLDGSRQTLTGDDVIATYPQPSSTAGTIAFSTPDGKVYLIHVN